MSCPSFLHFLILISVLISHLPSTIQAHEIWSIYFDDSNPSIANDHFHRREQLFDLPFEDTRYLFEISTYVSPATSSSIVRAELTVCEPQVYGQHLPEGATRLDGRDNRTWTCLERLVSVRAPLVTNQSLLQFPSEVGLPLGGGKDGPEQRLLLLIEYDQDYRQLGDNSGFDLHLADEKLAIEAGIMAMGAVPDARFFIPLNVSEWSSKGTCHSSCLDSEHERNPLQVVALFASTEHSLLREMIVEIDAHRKEKQTIFAWGGRRSVDISDGVAIEAGDDVNVRCSYNLSLNQTILGGLGPRHENCVVWVHYYPRVDHTKACLSSYTTATLMSLLNLNEFRLSYDPRSRPNLLEQNENIIKQEVQQRDRHNSWARHKLVRSKFIREHGGQRAQCAWHKHDETSLMDSSSSAAHTGPALIDVRLARPRTFPFASALFWR